MILCSCEIVMYRREDSLTNIQASAVLLEIIKLSIQSQLYWSGEMHHMTDHSAFEWSLVSYRSFIPLPGWETCFGLDTIN